MKKVAIVILNWNGWKDTVDCLKSLERINIKGLEVSIIVVDNGSTDNSIEKVSAHQSKKFKIQVIANNRNLGFAGGNNSGIKYAIEEKNDYVCIINNDTEVDPDFLLNLLNVFDRHTKCAAVSPKIYFAKGYEFKKGPKEGETYAKKDLGKVIWYAGGDIDWNNIYGSNHGVDQVDIGQFELSHETDFVTGACMVVRVDVMKKYGLFDEKYFLYFEDTDLSQRLKRQGYTIFFEPSARIYHKVSQSSGIGSSLNDYFLTRNRLLFGLRYARLRTRFALIRESFSLYFKGRPWQRIGVRDYYLRNFYQGTWKNS